MDFYVRAFGGLREHSEFYTNKTLLDAFQNYTRAIVTRYADQPNVLAWYVPLLTMPTVNISPVVNQGAR